MEFSDESHLIQLFTPHLQILIRNASDRLNIPLVLVNTERHAYFEDPHGGADSKPDMLVTHPAFFKYNCTEGDKKYDGGNFIFGQGADWCLRDCWEVIIEWKTEIGQNDFTALGEGIEFALRKSTALKDKTTVKDEKAMRFSRIMICDAHRFYLVLCYWGHPSRCVFGRWDDAGSEEAVVGFLAQGFQTEEWSRLWLTSITALCTEFNVQLVTPCEEAPSCFLGSGACGRVFRVRSVEEDKIECALKVGLGDDASSAIHEEWSKFRSFSAKFGAAGEALIKISCHFQSPDRAFAGIVLAPVGLALPRTKKSHQISTNGFDAALQIRFWTWGCSDM